MNELWKLDIQDFFQAQIPKFDLQVAGYLNDLVKEWTKIYSFIFNLETANVVENMEFYNSSYNWYILLFDNVCCNGCTDDFV